MAGYGMNAGIADAMNLSWLLAAAITGWAAPAILDAYELERKPITEQVSRFAMSHALALQKEREAVPADLEKPGPAGDALRAVTGQALYDLNVQQYCCAGLNFGYFYDSSPLIAYDGQMAPDYAMHTFTASTVPGCRTPHVWLSDGRSLYDVLGDDYALLRLDSTIDTAPLQRAAKARGMPLRVVDVSGPDVKDVYAEHLVLSRPDQHVAWRGNALPDDPGRLLDMLRGAAH